MTETTIQGHRMRLLSFRQASGVLLGTWEDLGQPVGSVFRVGVVATIEPVQETTAEPFMPWTHTYAVGYVPRPDPNPAARFLEALRQERAAERLGGPVVREQIWP
ncbi:hypothetical protein G6553_13215 [Nocardioides sp. IC4_145]|uniref:hypothetical protein n=1 Tax=Nocardioides sp. IC4_145 TaxID=2714037 RepID=UPI00140E0F4F|nr:hypothetical protein [Nocardioides sp. IC4_145]NHC24126.1 hypothetical protein [Nocardioides sp. IC4_145]